MKYIEYGWEELEVLTKASVPIMKQDTTDVLFGFAHLNAGCDMMGSYGGFSFRLYKNGLIIVQEYLFDGILAEERRYCVPQTCADEIKQYYLENQDTIFFSMLRIIILVMDRFLSFSSAMSGFQPLILNIMMRKHINV